MPSAWDVCMLADPPSTAAAGGSVIAASGGPAGCSFTAHVGLQRTAWCRRLANPQRAEPWREGEVGKRVYHPLLQWPFEGPHACFCPPPGSVRCRAARLEIRKVMDRPQPWFVMLMSSGLVEQARRGDLEAFNSLVERHQVAVYNLCLRMLGDRAAAEDATQEAFLSAYRAMEQLKGPYLGAWLLRIGANVCYDELRRRKRRPSHSLDELLDDPERPMALPTKGGGPEDESLRSELRRSIEQALLALPPDQRLAVVLCDVEGLSYDEIAGSDPCVAWHRKITDQPRSGQDAPPAARNEGTFSSAKASR